MDDADSAAETTHVRPCDAATAQQQLSEHQQAAAEEATDGAAHEATPGAAGVDDGAGSMSSGLEAALVDVCRDLCKDLGLPGHAAGQSLVQQVDAACEVVGVDKGAGTLVERANLCRRLLYGQNERTPGATTPSSVATRSPMPQPAASPRVE